MAGRFPLFTDACVNGHLVDALIQHGWNLVRAIDLYPERTPDPVVFARAAQEGRKIRACESASSSPPTPFVVC